MKIVRWFLGGTGMNGLTHSEDCSGLKNVQIFLIVIIWTTKKNEKT